MSGGSFDQGTLVAGGNAADKNNQKTLSKGGVSVKNMTVPSKASPNIHNSPIPTAPSSQPGSSPGTIKITVPVRSFWNAGAVTEPTVHPLANALQAIGHSGDNALIKKITLLSTTSNAPGTVKAVVSGVLPPNEKGEAQPLNNQFDHDGNGHTYIVPPGHHVHNEVLFENSLPDAGAVDLTSHAKIDPKTLAAKVVDVPALPNVMVFNNQSPELFNLMEPNVGKANFKSASIKSSGGNKFIDLSREEHNKFLEDYNKNIQDKIPKTNIANHTVTLKAWTPGAFGRQVAESAQTAEQRNQLGVADTQHEIIHHLQYEIVSQK